MCGIVGTVKYRDKEILHKMNEIQVHRGPDSEGVFWRINAVSWCLMVKFLMQIFSEKSY